MKNVEPVQDRRSEASLHTDATGSSRSRQVVILIYLGWEIVT